MALQRWRAAGLLLLLLLTIPSMTSKKRRFSRKTFSSQLLHETEARLAWIAWSSPREDASRHGQASKEHARLQIVASHILSQTTSNNGS